MQRRFVLGSALAALSSVAVIRSALAETYPSRPVRLLVPFPPGGSLDLVPRIVAGRMSALLGQTLVVENRVGASGRLAVNAARQSAPDGYTIIAINSVTHGSNPAVSHDLGYDPVLDLKPVALLAEAPLAVLVHRDVPARTLADLIALIRSRPGTLNYGSGGSGTQLHLAAAMLLTQAGLPAGTAVHIPYPGQAPAVTDLIAGRVQFMVTSTGSTMQYVRSGELRALATTGRERWFRLPDVPTLQEQGFTGFDVTAWAALAAPVGTPDSIVASLATAANDALRDHAVAMRLEDADFRPHGSTPAELGARIVAEVTRYRAVVSDAGLTTD